ncbi:hypothetical protein CL616_04685 [archaeon]|nr:hypothetical protein [archaeon]|tara:strand:+ start:5012 stop:5389 length:378 start_codon:yes stop_codon:yes gene_type:complete
MTNYILEIDEKNMGNIKGYLETNPQFQYGALIGDIRPSQNRIKLEIANLESESFPCTLEDPHGTTHGIVGRWSVKDQKVVIEINFTYNGGDIENNQSLNLALNKTIQITKERANDGKIYIENIDL